MERLLHYCWKHRIFPIGERQTTDGMPLEIIDPGLQNHDAGPDFFNAKIKIAGIVWVGNVELHRKSSDWFLHGHNRDPHYNNVILHVVGTADREVFTAEGKRLPQLELQIPARIQEKYEELTAGDAYPPCYRQIPGIDSLHVRSWLSALEAERLQQKSDAVLRRLRLLRGDWNATYFVTLARNYGFGVNGDAFERWAFSIPLLETVRLRDRPETVEAIFMGQAGLLDERLIPEYYRAQAMEEGYFSRLKCEYEYQRQRLCLCPTDVTQWKFLRMRPQNFPHIRLSQLARMIIEDKLRVSHLLNSDTVLAMEDVLKTRVNPYWETHYTFGSTSCKNGKNLSPLSLNLLLINTAVPLLMTYGRHLGNERLTERALDVLEQLRPEDNYLIRMWRACGIEARSAADSQALIQLKKQYCDRKDCLRCRFGHWILTRRQE